MPLYQNRFVGVVEAGDQFVFSWWTFTAETDISFMNDEAVTWVTEVWNGPGGTDGYAQFISAGVEVQRVSTGEIEVATGQQQRLADQDVSLPGTSASNPFPADVALVVSLRTALANRRGRGRFYLPQPAVNAGSADGKLTSAAQSDIVAALSNAWGNYNVAKSPVIYSRTARETNDVTTFNVGDLFDTQRRRENAITENRETATMP